MMAVLRYQAKGFQNYFEKTAFHIYYRYVYKFNIIKPFDITTKESIKRLKFITLSILKLTLKCSCSYKLMEMLPLLNRSFEVRL